MPYQQRKQPSKLFERPPMPSVRFREIMPTSQGKSEASMMLFTCPRIYLFQMQCDWRLIWLDNQYYSRILNDYIILSGPSGTKNMIWLASWGATQKLPLISFQVWHREATNHQPASLHHIPSRCSSLWWPESLFWGHSLQKFKSQNVSNHLCQAFFCSGTKNGEYLADAFV